MLWGDGPERCSGGVQVDGAGCSYDHQVLRELNEDGHAACLRREPEDPVVHDRNAARCVVAPRLGVDHGSLARQHHVQLANGLAVLRIPDTAECEGLVADAGRSRLVGLDFG